jgi:hypothetical protein
MGLSQYDPAPKERRAWNAARKVGAKRALKPRQIWAIRFSSIAKVGCAIARAAEDGSPVQFELMADTRASLLAWLERRGGTVEDFASRAGSIGQDPSARGSISAKRALIVDRRLP